MSTWTPPQDSVVTFSPPTDSVEWSPPKDSKEAGTSSLFQTPDTRTNQQITDEYSQKPFWQRAAEGIGAVPELAAWGAMAVPATIAGGVNAAGRAIGTGLAGGSLEDIGAAAKEGLGAGMQGTFDLTHTNPTTTPGKLAANAVTSGFTAVPELAGHAAGPGYQRELYKQMVYDKLAEEYKKSGKSLFGEAQDRLLQQAEDITEKNYSPTNLATGVESTVKGATEAGLYISGALGAGKMASDVGGVINRFKKPAIDPEIAKAKELKAQVEQQLTAEPAQQGRSSRPLSDSMDGELPLKDRTRVDGNILEDHPEIVANQKLPIDNPETGISDNQPIDYHKYQDQTELPFENRQEPFSPDTNPREPFGPPSENARAVRAFWNRMFEDKGLNYEKVVPADLKQQLDLQFHTDPEAVKGIVNDILAKHENGDLTQSQTIQQLHNVATSDRVAPESAVTATKALGGVSRSPNSGKFGQGGAISIDPTDFINAIKTRKQELLSLIKSLSDKYTGIIKSSDKYDEGTNTRGTRIQSLPQETKKALSELEAEITKHQNELRELYTTEVKLGQTKAGKSQRGSIGFFSKTPTIEAYKADLEKRAGESFPDSVITKMYQEKYGDTNKASAAVSTMPAFKAALSEKKQQAKALEKVADTLHSTRVMGDITSRGSAESYKEAQSKGYKGPMVDYIQNNMDNPSSLSDKAKVLYDQYIKPIKDRGEAAYAAIAKLDPTDPILKEYTGRIGANKGYWSRFFGGIGQTAGGGFRFGNEPGALKERVVFKATDESGNVAIISKTKDGSVLLSQDKNTKSIPNPDKVKIEPGTTFQGWKIEQATQKEIEQHTDLKYLRDPLFVGMIKTQELERYKMQLEALAKIKEMPEWKQYTSALEDVNPEHVALKYPDRIPALRNVRFDPSLAHIFDDFLKPGNSSALSQIIEGFNNLAIKSFMMLPIKHIDNEATHALVADGFTGMLPDAAKREALVQGMLDVKNMSPEYIDVARNGGSLLYPRSVADGWMHGTLDHLQTAAAKDPTFLNILQEAGLKPMEFFNAWSHMSGNIMWMTRDALYMSLIREWKTNHPNATTYETVKQVEQYMPNYRLPTKVLGSRGLSEVMQNRMLTVFSPYHYGALRAIGTSLKHLTTEGKRLEGLNHIAAYAFMSACVYPLMNAVYHAVGGNNNEEFRMAGGFHYIKLATKVAASAIKGGIKPDTSFMMQSALTPSPAPLAMFEDVANRTMWNGKRISNSQDPGLLQIADRLSYPVTETINPMGLKPVLKAAYEGQKVKAPFKQWILSQLMDVETDTAKKEYGIKTQALKDMEDSGKEMAKHSWRRAFK